MMAKSGAGVLNRLVSKNQLETVSCSVSPCQCRTSQVQLTKDACINAHACTHIYAGRFAYIKSTDCYLYIVYIYVCVWLI